MHVRVLFISVIVLLVLMAGCSASSSTDTTPPPPDSTGDTASEPTTTLPPGTHVGISWFAPPAPDQQERHLELWEEANAEATVGRVMVDWIDVEPIEGRYDFTELDEQLAAISERGARPMVTIAAVDVSGTPFPAWLGGFEPERAAAAYGRMLDAAAPTLEAHGVWLLAVANEPPLEDGLDPDEFADFVSAVEAHGDVAIPDIPITFVFAGGDALKRDPATERLADAVDVFAVNHYCLAADLTAIAPEAVESHLADAIELAGEKEVVLQELGCPASEALGSSERFQADWFTDAFAAIREDELVIAAFVFEFGDWSPELVELDYGEAIAAEPELDWLFDRLAAWLETSGLVRPDGTTRPAWDVYLANLGG